MSSALFDSNQLLHNGRSRVKDPTPKMLAGRLEGTPYLSSPPSINKVVASITKEQQQMQHRKRKFRNRRSATLSPAAHMRRKWDNYDDDRSESDSSGPLLSPVTLEAKTVVSQRSVSPFSPEVVKKKPDLPSFARRPPLRKTASEPTDLFVDECDRKKVEHIQDMLNSLNFTKFCSSNIVNFGLPNRHETLSPSASISSYVSGTSSPLITPSQSPDEIWATPRGSLLIPSTSRSNDNNGRRSSATNSESSDFLGTGIEELREAAQTIEALTRRSRRRPTDLTCSGSGSDSRTATVAAPSTANNYPPAPAPSAFVGAATLSPSDDDERMTMTHINLMQSPSGDLSGNMSDSSSLSRRSGITARLGGQPRGVMQFLPSVKSSEFLSKTAYETYLANKTRRTKLSTGVLQHSNSNGDDDSVSQMSINGDLLAPGVYPAGYVPTVHGRVSLPPSMPPSPALGYDLQFHNLRRKVSMPDRLYQLGHNFLPHSRTNLESVASQLALDHSNSFNVSPTISSTSSSNVPTGSDITVLVPPKSPRFSSFRGASATASRNRKLTRQYSQNDKQMSDTEAYIVGPESPLKGVDSLGSFSRFGRLLRSLRSSRQNSPELNLLSPTSSDSPLSSPGVTLEKSILYNKAANHARIYAPPRTTSVSMSQSWHGHVHDMHMGAVSDSDSSMLQADLLLWQKRSKGSLRRHEDTRTHVVKELYDTEASYVENLQLIVHKYLRPLKRPELCSLIDPTLVDEIFFQIPEVLGHHELFFAALKSRLDNWDNRQKIGDIILNNFTKQSVIDTYTAFINNWKSAKHAIRAACQAKPAFAKYLERCSREHKNKLTLDALLIMPVQRIPRYELLIKELLKHTSVEHPDHPLLVRAQKEIHDLATKINHVEQEAGLSEQMQQRLREIEAIVDGLDDLVSQDRIFYRYDLVWVSTHGGKKERCLFLFSDQLIITNVKRKSAAALRKIPTVSPSSCNFLESHKFKLLMKISLDDLEVTKNNTVLLSKIQDEVSHYQEDLRVLGKVSELVSLLKANKDDIDKEVDRLKDNIRRQLSDKNQEMSTNPTLTSLDLFVTTEAGVEALTVSFQSADKRVTWEKCFCDAKEALALSLARRPPPIFMKCIAAQRTRAGLHFTCATPTLGRNEYGYPNVWVCNSDGYVGQVCVINLTPEPDLSSCNGITNSRILCVCAVPDAKRSGPKKMSRKNSNATNSSPVSQDSGSVVDSGYNLELDSDSSDNESSAEGSTGKGSKTIVAGCANGSVESEKTPSTTPISKQSLPASSEQQQLQQQEESQEESVPTMWLGTEDGCIHIFNYNDSVRTRKNKTRVQHGSPVTSIVYVDDRVFASLASGVIIFYERDTDGTWNLEHHRTMEFDVYQGHLSPLLYVTNKIWCGARNRVLVLNPHLLKVETLFAASSDTDCHIGCMVTVGLGVWLSMQTSPVIKLYHAHSYECLLEINVSPTVTKILAGCDDIIRQHKLACLRITALLCCKDLLWIGTSSGVILQLPLPHINHNTTRLSNISPPICAPLGHCGPCRFLTSVELHSNSLSASGSRTNSFATIADLSKRRMSLNVATLQQGKVYVISGGDGFEDFQDISNDDSDDNTGKDDSTNHLLIWQV